MEECVNEYCKNKHNAGGDDKHKLTNVEMNYQLFFEIISENGVQNSLKRSIEECHIWKSASYKNNI